MTWTNLGCGRRGEEAVGSTLKAEPTKQMAEGLGEEKQLEEWQ